MMRRRLLLSDNPYTADGYIKRGLIFFLDGLNKGNDNTKWIDKIGGREFTLINCIINNDSVDFSSSQARGEYHGNIGTSWDIDTIEISLDNMNSQACILSQDRSDNNSYLNFMIGAGTNGAYRCDGNAQPRALIDRQTLTNTKMSYSLNSEFIIQNGFQKSFGNNDSWGSNLTGTTYLGCRQNLSYSFKGKLYAVRIYNRHLSISEMIHNQTIDNTRYNLGHTI